MDWDNLTYKEPRQTDIIQKGKRVVLIFERAKSGKEYISGKERRCNAWKETKDPRRLILHLYYFM